MVHTGGLLFESESETLRWGRGTDGAGGVCSGMSAEDGGGKERCAKENERAAMAYFLLGAPSGLT